jgi:hypothetical protein
MDPDTIPYRYLSETIGIPIEIILNDFNEFHGNEHQKILMMYYAGMEICWEQEMERKLFLKKITVRF